MSDCCALIASQLATAALVLLVLMVLIAIQLATVALLLLFLLLLIASQLANVALVMLFLMMLIASQLATVAFVLLLLMMPIVLIQLAVLYSSQSAHLVLHCALWMDPHCPLLAGWLKHQMRKLVAGCHALHLQPDCNAMCYC